MRQQVIIVGGTPSIGKTSTAKEIFLRRENTAWVDGDYMWKVNPFEIYEPRFLTIHANMGAVIRNYLTAGFSFVVCSWVFPRFQAVERTAAGLTGLEYDLFPFRLISDEETLRERSRQQGKPRDPDPDWLEKERQNGMALVETTGRSPAEIADDIIAITQNPEQAGLVKHQDAGSVTWRPKE